MSGTCFKCKQICIYKEPSKNSNDTFGFPCDYCKNTLCRKCSEFSSTEIRTLTLSNRVMPYMCRDCVPKLKEVFHLSTRVSSLESVVTEIKANFHSVLELLNEFKELKESLMDMRLGFNSALDKIKTEISSIKSDSSGNQNVQTPSSHQVGSGDDVMHEISERQKRSCNLMIFNFPEKGEQEDGNAAKALILDLTSDNIPIKSVSRIGRKNKNGYRSMRVTLHNAEDVRKVIRSKRNIDKSQKVFIDNDLTSQQRENLNNLKNEIKVRQQNGEQNLILKYVNGTPRIVSKN